MRKSSFSLIALTTLLIISLQVQPVFMHVYAAEDNTIQGITEEQLHSEMNKYSQPVATMSKSSGGSGTQLISACMGNSDYTPTVPDSSQLDANSITSTSYFSPARFNNEWYIWDHVGLTDTAYQGKRHIAKRTTGVQWFGYDSPPYNDMLLRNFSNEINSNNGAFKINIKQAPVRADWHTINGSGILFGVASSNKAVVGGNDYDMIDKSNSGNHANLVSGATGSGMSGYAFVATNHYNELRYYDNVSIQDFINGIADYYLIEQHDKTCNSQSLTVSYDGKNLILNVGNAQWNTEPLACGQAMSVGKVSGKAGTGEATATVTWTLPQPGTWSGAMVDYAPHACESLSSVYMFNYTFNDYEYF